MKNVVLKVHPDDNVLVALTTLVKGSEVAYDGVTYTMQEDIPTKHKFFTHDMNQGDIITMYGVMVGKTQYAVRAGSRMSTENTSHAAEPYDYRVSGFRCQVMDSYENLNHCV